MSSIGFVPSPAKLRSLAPADASQALSLESLAPQPVVTAATPVEFKVAIGEDLAEGGGKPKPFQAIREIDKQTYLAAAAESGRIARYPYRFSKTLTVMLGTYMRTNECELTLTLDGNIASKPVECKGLQDNGQARFVFDSPLSPGVYSARLTSTAIDGANGVSAYLQRSATSGELWLLPGSWPESTTAFAVLVTWARSAPVLAVLYLACVAVLLALLMRQGSLAGTWIWGVPLLSLLIGACLITRPFSGHDETAHIDLFQLAASNSSKDSRAEFFNEVRSEMINQDFFRLHSVAPQAEGTCPHNILGRCGQQELALGYYRQLARAWTPLHPAAWSVGQYLWAGRATNLLIALATLLFVYVIFGATLSKGVWALATFLGAIFSQVASVTNDMPMYLAGIFALALLGSLALELTRVRRLIGYAVFVGLLFTVRQVDRSWLAGVAVLLVVPVLLTKPMLLDYKVRQRGLMSLVVFGGVAFVGVLGAFFFGREFVRSSGVIRDLLDQARDAKLLSTLVTLSLSQVDNALYQHLVSAFGSFVWGHSYYAGWIYRMFTVFWLAVSAIGIYLIGATAPSNRVGLAKAGTLGIVFGAHLVAVLAIVASRMQAPEIVWQSFAKIRLTAPGLGALFAPALIGVIFLQGRQGASRQLFRGVCIWSLVLLVHYLPRFYLADLR